MTLQDPALVWRPTNAPVASSRTDDIWFVSPDEGWAVNSNGQIIKTEDGGNSWVQQHFDRRAYLRCIGFSGKTIGWVGSVSPTKRMFATRDGAHWDPVGNLPPTPVKVCGISVIDDLTVFASGTNDPRDRPAVLKTTDGGAHWTSIDMRGHASMLIDIHFQTRDRGWVVGGFAPAVPGPVTRAMVQPVVLFTEDGGATWTDLVSDKTGFPFGEWGWKIFFVDDRVGFISLENFNDGAILKSVDGGRTWRRLPINDPQQNSDLEGVGFISEQVGWVGGWGNTSRTEDGGQQWADANEVGSVLNRFRFFGNPVTVGYASGKTVYKYSAEPAGTAGLEATSPKLLRSLETTAGGGADSVIEIPTGTRSLRADLWDRFGNHLEVEYQENPAAGERTIKVDAQAAVSAGLSGPAGILRVVVDDQVESRLVPLR